MQRRDRDNYLNLILISSLSRSHVSEMLLQFLQECGCTACMVCKNLKTRSFTYSRHKNEEHNGPFVTFRNLSRTSREVHEVVGQAVGDGLARSAAFISSLMLRRCARFAGLRNV
jgi:hypothetical protein